MECLCVCVCIKYKYKYNPNLNNINNGNKMKNNLGLDDCLSTCMIYNILLKRRPHSMDENKIK